MTNVSFWVDSAPIQKFPRLQRNINVDVVVIGAGVTGITVVYLLKKSGSTVALIERARVAAIDTGHTTAHATWNYLRENKDYPYHMIKDWLVRPEADSVRKLKRAMV
jgi:glycine/D-amino acid oxidase-like deaminating enzyme